MTAAAPPPRQSSARGPGGLRRVLRFAASSLVALWSVLLLAWLTLHWGILDHIDEWRPQIEQRVSKALGASVQIGRLVVRSGGWVPALEARDVVVRDAAGREALRLPHVLAALSPRSLLALEPRLEQLYVDGADVELRRDRAGRLFVGGIEIGPGPPAAGGRNAAADWFFRQHEFVVRGGTVRWRDDQRPDAPPLALTALDLVVRNGLRQHDLRLDATPPAAWGERFTLRGRFTQPLLAAPSDWQRWSGTLYAELPRADVGELRRYADLPFELSEGDGALRGWLDVADGEPRALTLDVALRAVALRLAKNVEPMAFERVEGRIGAARSADGVVLAAERFGFTTGDGLVWPRGDIRVAWRQRRSAAGAPPAPVTGGEFSADRLDLGLMAAVASHVPLGDAVRKLLAETAPRGVVRRLAVRWDGPLDAPSHYDVKAAFEGLAVAAHPAADPHVVGRPGLANADLELVADEKGGNARIDLARGALDLPGVLEGGVLPLDRFAGQLAWTITPAKADGAAPAVEVRLRNASFANADAQGRLDATWRSGPGAGFARGGRYPGLLDLDGRLDRGQAAHVARYLPLGLPDSVRRYVARAVGAGTLTNGSFRVKGDLWDFPFGGNRPGEFRIAARLEGGAFAYVPSEPASGAQPASESTWPAFADVSGELVFDRLSMEVKNARARVFGYELADVQGGIRNLGERPLLALQGSGRGPLADALRYVNASPVGAWIGDALRQTSASGNADLKLALSIPLWDVKQTTLRGTVTLAGNDLRLRPDTPLLGAARGRVDFSQRGFSIAGGSARVLGGDATFEGGLQADGSLRFSGQGRASAEALRRAGELGFVARVAGSLSGQASYRLALGFVKGRPEIQVTSNLVGMAVDLPAPLGKPADAPLPLRYQTALVPDSLGGEGPARETLRLELGNVVQAQYLRQLGAETQVLRGGIGVFEPAPQPAQGVHASATLARVDLDAWQAVARRWAAPAPAPAAPGASAPRAANGAPADAESEGDAYLPSVIALRAQQATVASRPLTHVVAGVSHADDAWRANLDADQLDGYVEYRPPRRGSAGLVYARLARLVLPKSEADSVETLLDRPAEPTSSVPALDIVVGDFTLRDKKLGRVEIAATNRPAPGEGAAGREGREWRLTRLAIVTPEAQLAGTGQWAPGPAGKRVATLDFTLDIADSGALLERLGTPKALRGGKGKMAGRVSWLGSPLTPDFRSMSGQIEIALASGQFLKAEPGAARLLGVLSLQALPRRLLLDFRDVFQQGFAFDSVTGDVTIDQGVAHTNNLRMRGVQAVVLMEGDADLRRETTDLRVVVVPEINAGTASLAYAAINPAVGLGTFLAQLFLRKPLIAAGTREFRVSGPWDDPKVERVERKPGEPAPTAEAPAASAPAKE